MLKRTLFFVNPYHLSVKNKQLVVRNKKTEKVKTIPISDLGYVLIDNSQITFTASVAQYFALHNVCLIFCNSRHHPVSMSLNLDANTIQGELFDLQIKASKPLKDNLWKQTVKAKIKNQAGVLRKLNKQYNYLSNTAKAVKTGDSTMQEAKAARYYWKCLFATIDFKRERTGNQPNPMLNYAYAVLRAATAKALMGSGLLPTFGIFHKNRYNAYRLADDIMEPYRPFVDMLVFKTFEKHKKTFELITKQQQQTELDKEENEEEEEEEDEIETNTGLTTEIKAELLKILTTDVTLNKLNRPLSVALSYTTASLVRCFEGETRTILYPELN